MYTFEISGITVNYNFFAGQAETRDNDSVAPSIAIKAVKIGSQDAWDFVESCDDESEAYEFSSTLNRIEEITLQYHLDYRV